MMFDSWWLWPFGFAFAGIMALVMAVVFIFWIWMIVDCARRSFRNQTEKIVWLVVVILLGWLGALAYLLVVRMNNPKGLSAK